MRYFPDFLVFQSFLSLFVDESNTANQARRRMTADDDNPLSPVVTDSMDSFLASSSNPPSVARNMVRFRDIFRFSFCI